MQSWPSITSQIEFSFCVGALAISGSLHHIDKDLLGWWLCERQVKSGGLNGRPEKLPDVCYSWWVLSSLIMIDRVQWIHKEKLVKFILDCQVYETVEMMILKPEAAEQPQQPRPRQSRW